MFRRLIFTFTGIILLSYSFVGCGVRPQVDFYMAPLLYMLDVPLSLFTPIFALSRTAGWVAHVLEQYANNRLIRPLTQYAGPDPRPYVPMADR